MRLIVIILLIFFFYNCSQNSVESEKNDFQLTDTIQISNGQKIINDEENIFVRFDELLSDGRCPTDLRCFWEGNAEVRFIFGKENDEIIFTLNTAGSYYTKDTILFRYNIELIDLVPYPNSKKKIRDEDYSALISIAKSAK